MEHFVGKLKKPILRAKLAQQKISKHLYNNNKEKATDILPSNYRLLNATPPPPPTPYLTIIRVASKEMYGNSGKNSNKIGSKSDQIPDQILGTSVVCVH